jgi:CHASE2 domain-containing sensor protein/predicted Ser/Thr protein kinase
MLGDARTRKALGLLAVGLLAASVGLVAHGTGFLGSLERDSVDTRFSLRGSERPPSDVVVVGLDNNSLGQLPRYPFSRRLHAQVLERLHRAGARLIVYDISFDRPTSEAADLALFETARRSAPVVFATSLISPSGETEVLGGNANLASIGAQAAAADLLPDSDGVLRHTLANVNGLPSIASAVAKHLTGHGDQRQLRGGWIDFSGPPGTVHRLSFVKVLDGRFDRASVRGKVVVVGATAPVLQDMHATATGSPMPGPEVQADAIATALADFPLRSPAGVVTILLISLLALLVPLCGLRLGTLATCGAGLALLGLWSLATQLSFDSGTVLEYSDPLSALLLSTVGTVILGIRADGHERKRLRRMFAADAGDVVEQVLHPGGPKPIEPTAIIAGYRIEDELGRGGMGVVYRARQLTLDREVAIKLIATDRAENPVFRERFKSESRIAASIEHANVIPVYEAGEDDGLLFIAMRLVDGYDLGQLLERVGTLAPDRTARIVVQIAGALDAAHARDLVHRDVKPANVLLTLENPEHAYLTDFGLAKQVDAHARITRADQWVGTLNYLSPEQIRGEPLTPSADIYSLTCLLYHCLIGQPPFPRDSQAATMWAHVHDSPPSIASGRPDLPDALDTVIARGMAKDPSERFPTGRELAEAAAHALGVPVASNIERPLPARAADRPGQSEPTYLSD